MYIEFFLSIKARIGMDIVGKDAVRNVFRVILSIKNPLSKSRSHERSSLTT